MDALTTRALWGGLARACGDQGRFEEAADHLRHCLIIAEEALGRDETIGPLEFKVGYAADSDRRDPD